MDDDCHGSCACPITTFLRAVPILFELEDAAVSRLALLAEPVAFEPGERILSQGDTDAGRRFYIIRSGSADVLQRNATGDEQAVARLSVGSYFGELGLLTDQPRNATVRARGQSPLRAFGFDALTFHRHVAEEVLAFQVEARRSGARRRAGSGRLSTKDLGLLDGMPQADRDFILQHAEHRWFPSRASIVTQGEPGDRFHVVLEGTVHVERDGEVVAELSAGDFFGETALLLDLDRTATVRACEHTLTWSIRRGAFQRLVGHRLMSNPRTKALILRRVPETISLAP